MTTRPAGGGRPAGLVDLRAAVRGSSSNVNRLDALEELVDRAPRGLTGFLTEVALDAGAELDVRLSAVGALGETTEPAARDGLVAALKTSDQPVVRRAAQRLGVIGDADNLEDLKTIRTGNTATQEAVRFAKQLISYRHRLGEYRVEAPGRRVRPDQGAAIAVEVASLPARDRADIEERISEPVLGLQLTTEGARRLSCEGSDLNVLPSRDLVAAGLDWLLQGQAAPAAVLERNPETGEFFASHVVLTDPSRGRELTIHVARSSGVVVLTGQGVVSEDGVRFELATVPTPHLPPTTVSGQFHPAQGLEFERVLSEVRLSAAQLRKVRAPSPVTGPTG
jgi:HEAT repeat protein